MHLLRDRTGCILAAARCGRSAEAALRFQGPGTTRWYDGEKRTVASQHSCSGAIVQDVWQVAQAAAVLVWVRALPSHGRARTALGLRQPVKEVSGSPLAKLSDSTWVNIFQNPARRRTREPLWKSPGCTWALPRLLAPLGSPLRRLWAPSLNTRDVSFKIEAKQESKRCARNLKTICDAVRPEGCQTTYAKGHPRNASPEETCAKDGPDLCTRERFVKHGKHSQEAHCSNLR